MTSRSLLVAAGMTWMVAAGATAAQNQPFTTVWDGVYTAGEADRGRDAAARLCGRCHGDDLKGGQVHGLIGTPFFERWTNLRLLDVVSYIQTAMPHEHEFVVPAATTRDIVGYMLRESGIPAGRTEMAKDVNTQADILITRRPVN